MAGNYFQRIMGRMRDAYTPQSTAGSDFFTGPGSAAAFGSEATGDTSVQDWMKGIPEVQRRQRRVEQLRAMNEMANEKASAEDSGGLMLPTHKGGLYETVARWRPDYAQMADKAMGGLQGYMGGKVEEGEAQGLDQAKTNMLLRGMQQYSGGPMQGDEGIRLPGAANAAMANRGRNLMSWFQP